MISHLDDGRKSARRLGGSRVLLDSLKDAELNIIKDAREIILKKLRNLIKDPLPLDKEAGNEIVKYSWSWLQFPVDQPTTPIVYCTSKKPSFTLIDCVYHACTQKWYWPQEEDVFHVLHVQRQCKGEGYTIRMGNISPHSAPFFVPDVTASSLPQKDGDEDSAVQAIYDLYHGVVSGSEDGCCSRKEFIILLTFEEFSIAF